MKKIIECVPNFSEGRNQDTINAIARAIKETKGCRILDVDPGYSTNRTVYTFVGDPEAVVEGALAAARTARKLIDMRKHKGEHPRFGAMDVCPFIPAVNISMEECINIAEKFAKKAAEELQIPIFLYEQSAKHDYRRTLPDIRQGEYEALDRKLKEPKWKPDFGPTEFIPQWGATAVGARMFLIAYNINILGTSHQAHRIALNLREAGRGEDQPGRLKDVKGMGWFVDEYNMAQVTVNLNNYKTTSIHQVFEEVKKEAAALNVGVAGSEIIGIVPLEAILMAAEFYIKRENLFILDEDQKIRLAVERLGLNSTAPFKPEEKIIEYIVSDPPDEPYAQMSLRDFILEAGSRSSAPGGGSVSAALAAMGTGLGAMAAKLTWGVRKFEALDEKMRQIIRPLHELSRELIPMIDEDTRAFNEYMEGLRMPKTNEEEKKARLEKMQKGLKNAIAVPLKTMELGNSAWDAMCDVARYGNPAAKSDIKVGARSLETGIWGAYQNVLINMKSIKDKDYKAKILSKAEAIAKKAEEKCAEVLKILEHQ